MAGGQERLDAQIAPFWRSKDWSLGRPVEWAPLKWFRCAEAGGLDQASVLVLHSSLCKPGISYEGPASSPLLCLWLLVPGEAAAAATDGATLG